MPSPTVVRGVPSLAPATTLVLKARAFPPGPTPCRPNPGFWHGRRCHFSSAWISGLNGPLFREPHSLPPYPRPLSEPQPRDLERSSTRASSPASSVFPPALRRCAACAAEARISRVVLAPFSDPHPRWPDMSPAVKRPARGSSLCFHTADRRAAPSTSARGLTLFCFLIGIWWGGPLSDRSTTCAP